MTPEQVVQANVDAYNKRDIETFMSCFTADIRFYNFADGRQTMEGRDQCRKFYEEVFDSSPNLYSSIVNRIVFDNKVIDHEQITGRMGSKDIVELVLIYEVTGDKISKVTVIRT